MKRSCVNDSSSKPMIRKKINVDLKNSRNSLPSNMIELGNEFYVSVSQFLGHTRVHVRKFVRDEDGYLQATKDGVSLSPYVWHYFCLEVKPILNHKSSDKAFIIQRDLCISKQIKDGVQVFVFQRLFQRKDLTMQFVPECAVLRGPELGKLCDNLSVITGMVKDSLITYSLSYCVGKEIESSRMQLQPVDDPDGFLVLLESLQKCLCAAITIKITELINCFGCRDGYPSGFMHACQTKTQMEKWSEYFDLALFQLDMNKLGKDLVQKNLHVDFDTVLGVGEFFDSLKVNEIFNSVQKLYIGEEKSMFDEDDLIMC